jgi:5-methylcytosine-specific restriction protein A
MKLCNFLRFDPSYPGVGLKAGGKMERVVWEEFANDRERLREVAGLIAENFGSAAGPSPEAADDDDEDAFPEGRVLYRLHRTIERNRDLVGTVKRKAESAGALSCQACGFDFLETYGELGRGFIECHHTVPISEYGVSKLTRPADLALVCSNCHRMLHRRRPWLLIDELSRLLNR